MKGVSLRISELVERAALPGLFEPLALFPKSVLHLLRHEPDQAGGKLVHKGREPGLGQKWAPLGHEHGQEKEDQAADQPSLDHPKQAAAQTVQPAQHDRFHELAQSGPDENNGPEHAQKKQDIADDRRILRVGQNLLDRLHDLAIVGVGHDKPGDQPENGGELLDQTPEQPPDQGVPENDDECDIQSIHDRSNVSFAFGKADMHV